MVEDLVERHDMRAHVRLEHLEGEVRGGHLTRDRDGLPLQLTWRKRALRNQARTVALAHRGAVGEERVLVRDVRISMNRNRRHLQLAVHGAAVQRLDVLKLVNELEIAGIDQVIGERVKHEGVVGVGRMGDADRCSHQVLPWFMVFRAGRLR